MFENKDCPICSLKSECIKRDDMDKFVCRRCGSFLVSKEALEGFKNEMKNPMLSAWIREKKEFNRPIPEIMYTTLEDILEKLPKYTPTQKQLILLRAILPFGVIIPPQGWDYLDKYCLEPAFMDQVFVAMSFSKELVPIWEKGIEPAVKKAGYKPYRVDKKPYLGRIDAKIMTEIRNSRFLIADVTEQKQGVYFEAGFAKGLGRPVIWTVRKDDLKNVHFNTRQYNHIVWENLEELKERLYYLICDTVGKNK